MNLFPQRELPPKPPPVDDGRPKCRHCGLHSRSRPKGLCWRCSVTPAIREQYPAADNKFARLGEGIGNGRVTEPEPTTALPGSAEKVAILEKRVAARQSLFHRGDAPMPDERHDLQPMEVCQYHETRRPLDLQPARYHGPKLAS